MRRTHRLLALLLALVLGMSPLLGTQEATAQSGAPYPTPGTTYPPGTNPAPQQTYPPPTQTYPPPTQTYPPATRSYPPPATATPAPGGTYGGQEDTYTTDEIVNAGHGFFGKVTEGLASVVEHAVASYGLPNGYILGQEGSAAIIGGLRYGEGALYTKNAGQHQIFWQGPSIGFDVGGEGNRTMMLVYNLPSVDAIYDRFAGVAGSAYLVAGVGMTVLAGQGMYVVPIVSGVGARLGVNIGYLKFTPKATWNPF